MEKFLEITYLFDFYQMLLTPKQRELISGYYFDDLSLGELASMHNISRQSVFDSIKKAQQKLMDYEEKLRMFEKHQEQQLKLAKMKEMTSNARQTLEGEGKQYAESIYKVIEELTTEI